LDSPHFTGFTKWARRAHLLFEGIEFRMTSTYTRERELADEIAPAVERRLPEVEVLAVELVSPGRFCVYIDRPGGVDHALCERVTRLLDDYRADFTIDVSSPGPERPLRKPTHFAAAVGRRVAVRTDGEIAGRSRLRGELLDAGDDSVTLEVAGEPAPLAIPYGAIVRANLIDEG
jgi:ribosome maturation factor RimP